MKLKGLEYVDFKQQIVALEEVVQQHQVMLQMEQLHLDFLKEEIKKYPEPKLPDIKEADKETKV